MALETKTVVVPGVKVNVPAAVRVFPPYTMQGLDVGAYVSADDQVTIVVTNDTGSPINLGNGIWRVVVENYPLEQ
jgi:hypothetical protein